jgi:hypothetical protein
MSESEPDLSKKSDIQEFDTLREKVKHRGYMDGFNKLPKETFENFTAGGDSRIFTPEETGKLTEDYNNAYQRGTAVREKKNSELL